MFVSYLKMQKIINLSLMSLIYSVIGQDPVANLPQGRVVGVRFLRRSIDK